MGLGLGFKKSEVVFLLLDYSGRFIVVKLYAGQFVVVGYSGWFILVRLGYSVGSLW